MACLDTDFLVAYLRNDPKARSKLEELDSVEEPVHTTIINAFELYNGAFKAKDTHNELTRVDKLLDTFFILMLDRDAAKSAGALHDKSNPIGESDLLIASIALSNNQTLITKNRKHFERVSGLQVEGW